MYCFICVIQSISGIFIIIKYIYNPLLIDVLVAHGVVVAYLVNGRVPAAIRASVITAFTRSSEALISRVVLLSQNVKTAHLRYYKDLREIIFHLRFTFTVMMLFTSVSVK